MKTIIAGSRTISDPTLVAQAVKAAGWPVTEVVCGEARGPDTHGAQWAKANGINVASFPADWSTGIGAGFERNREMAWYAQALIAIWDGCSKGTEHMIETAQANGLRVHVETVMQQDEVKTEPLIFHAESGSAWYGEPSQHDYDHCWVGADPARLDAGTIIDLGIGQSTVRPSFDFETYSEAGFCITPDGKVSSAKARSKGGLPLVGTAVYATHPSTEVLCLYYDLKDGKGRRAFIPGGPEPSDLLEHIANGGDMEAFNITFEWWIWNMVCVRQYGWPPLPLAQCHCVMARARRFNVPGNLGGCAKALGTPDKDAEGSKLLNKLSRPQSATKTRPLHRWTPATAAADFGNLYRYCDQDVYAEDCAAARIPDLTPFEHEVWLTDQRINARGVQVDTEALDAALYTLEQATEKYTAELRVITQGAVGTVSEGEKFVAWLQANRCGIHDIQAETVEMALEWDLMPHVRRALEIRQMLSSANVKKLPKLKHQISGDGRLRNQYMYCGADRTGRWSSSAADDEQKGGSNSQLQNITAKGPKSKECVDCGRIVGRDCSLETHVSPAGHCPACGSNNWKDRKDWTVEAVEYAVADIKHRDLAMLERIWGDPIALLCGCLRGLFVAGPGKRFICVDFSAIEAVVMACLSRCQWRIDVFNTHAKIYEMSASKISGVPFEEMMAYKDQNGHDHPLRKSLGKVAELASGFGGWVGSWMAFGAEEHFANEDEIKQAIIGWREASPEIVEFWGGQFRQTGKYMSEGYPELYGLEGAAIAAIQNPGQCFSVGDITYGVYKDILYCRLPSGRFLHYHQPRLVQRESKIKRRPPEQCITFMAQNTNPKKGPRGWVRLETYGGMLAENVTQAVARDIQAEAMVRCEQRGYPWVMHTHDEGVGEVDQDAGSLEEMVSIMTERPSWASWWPIRGAGWVHTRYQKD